MPIVFPLGFTYHGPMQTLFSTSAMTAREWLRAIAVAPSVLRLVEPEKLLQRRYTGQAQPCASHSSPALLS